MAEPPSWLLITQPFGAKVFVFPVTQAIASMGTQRFRFAEAKAVLAALENEDSTDSSAWKTS
jgi:hypothetical protein